MNMAIDSKQGDDRFETTSNASNATFQMKTPPTTTEDTECLWSGSGAVPWPEITFQIIEKQSGRAITLVGDQPKLHRLSSTSSLNTHWLCVKKNGYFGFQNLHTGKYLGHDGKSGICTSTFHLKKWELWTPRQHPEGGHELLSPYHSDTLMLLCIDEDGSTLIRRRHGNTLWEFVRV